MVNIVSYNARGLGSYQKRKKVFKFFRDQNHDVVFIQESHSTRKIEKLWKTQWGRQIFYAHGEHNARGCAILVKRHVKTKINKVIKDPHRRFLILDLEISSYQLIMCNI